MVIDFYIFTTTIQQMESQKIDYILTHVAPACFNIEVAINLVPIPKASSEKSLNNLVEAVLKLENIPYWLFAHYHQRAIGQHLNDNKKIAWRALRVGEVFK